jgi:predicted lipoprotein with Yx(FWY)xxD motif
MLPFNKLVIPTAVGASLLLAACGGSSSSSSSTAASASPSSSPPASSSSASLTIGTGKGSVGTYLTGTSGRALYIFVADGTGKSNCSGACAQAWPPLTASSMPKVTGGASAADLSLISRSDGTKQVAYKGRPLYYYVGDPGAGTTNGQGSNQFGAKWWLISPSGGQVGASSATASSSGSSSSSSSGGSSGSSSSSSGGGWG